MNSKDFPRRGEIWLVNFNPGRGSEQKGRRPALVIQNDVGNRHAATVIVCAITTTIKIYPVTVFLPKKESGLPQDSMINLAQVLTLDKNRLIRCLGKLDPAKMKKVDEAIKVSLGVN